MALVGVVRAEFLRARNFEFVRAARALGVGDVQIMVRHVLPNATVADADLPSLSAQRRHHHADRARLSRVRVYRLEEPSIGRLLSAGQVGICMHPGSGITLFHARWRLVLTLLIFIGEAVRDAFDPRRTLAVPGNL